MSRAIEGPMDWHNPYHVTDWVNEQAVRTARTVRCLDSRETVSAEGIKLITDARDLQPGVEVTFVDDNPGGLNIPGQVAGLATVIHLSTGLDADTSFEYASGYIAERGLGQVPNHTDTRHILTDRIRGCGLKGLLRDDPDVLDVDPRTGLTIVRNVIQAPVQDVTVYDGQYEASAWLNSSLTKRSVKQRSPQGSVFLAEQGRASAMFSHPKKGLAVFLQHRGVDVLPRELLVAHNTIVDQVAEVLAPDIPRYTIFPKHNGQIGVRRHNA